MILDTAKKSVCKPHKLDLLLFRRLSVHVRVYLYTNIIVIVIG